MDITNWKITGKRMVHENPHYKVIEEDVVRPDGTKANYYVLKKRTPFFSIVIPLTQQNETYLVRQYRIPARALSWEFPMGGVDNKTPLETAQQELKEETGMVAQEWKEIGWFYVANGHTDQKGYVFVAKNLRQEEANPEPGEFLEIKKMPMNAIGEMIKEGEITDGPSIVAYYFYLSRNS